MRLLYVTNGRVPSRGTHSIQVMHMCAAFAAAGADVELAHPWFLNGRPEGYRGDVWSFYGVQPTFEVRTIPSVLTTDMPPWAARAFRLPPLAAFLWWRSRPGAAPFVCYSRSYLGAWLAAGARERWGKRSACRTVALELHDLPRGERNWDLLGRVDALFPISGALRERILERRPELEERIQVEHDGVDVEKFRADVAAAEDAVAVEGRDGPLVVYTGRVNREKGAHVLLEAARHLPRIGGRVLAVGKVYDEAFASEAAALGNVSCTGFVPPSDVPRYVAGADVLALPSTADLAYSAYMSPLKLFEYMASGRPAVVADLPVLREVVEHERNALLFEPGSGEALAAAVERLWRSPELARRLADQALADVERYSWRNRAERILGRLEGVPAPPGAADRHETARYG